MKLYNRIIIKRKSIVIIVAFIIIAVLVSLFVVIWVKTDTALSPTLPKNLTTKKNDVIETEKIVKKEVIVEKPIIPSFDKSKYSTTVPSSIWVVVNKQHPLVPISYTPVNLITTVGATISSSAQIDFEAMNNTALASGINFTIVSSYRSYDTQNYLYNNYVASYGQVASDTFSARPGYSEHQTGFTIDLGSSTGASCNLDSCFRSTIEGTWLAQHAYEYGFLLRYPIDKQQITGYMSEPWHFRYIGRELALEMKNKSISTLEEFFNISGGEIYL
ncbi:MAG: M15 family metallopeptidase [Candidatus Saccharibacteria bacterium]